MVVALLSHTAFADSSAQKMTPQQALLQAVSSNSLAGVKTAIQQGANVNAPDAFGTTPLMTVSLITFKTLSPIIPYLVSEGASLTAKDKNGCTALDYALLGFTPETISFLESKKAPIGTNALVNAINQKNIPAVEKALKDPHANPNLVVGQGPLLALLTCSDTENSLQIAETLLKAGASVNLLDAFGNTPLMNAVQENSPKMAALLIRSKADLNFQDKVGCTALMDAVIQGNLLLTKALVSAGAATTPRATQQYYSDTALLIAMNQQTPSLLIVQALLQAPDLHDTPHMKGSLNMQDSNGWTALIYAVSANNLPLTQALVSAGAKSTLQANALGIAVTNQTLSLPIVQALLKAPDAKDSINLSNNNGETPLMIAAFRGNFPITQALIAAGADATIADKQGDTALSVAQPNCKPALEAALATANSNLLNAVANNDLPGVNKALAAGANPNIDLSQIMGAGNSQSLLTITANHNNTAIAEALIAAKANVDFQNYQGATALIYAASNGNLEIVNALLAAGANPNFQTNAANTSTTALIAATHFNYTPIVEALLKAPTISQSINFQDTTGMTALMYAAQNNSLPILQLLVKIPGININLVNNNQNAPGDLGQGSTAFDYTTNQNCTDFLKQHGAVSGFTAS